jgi:hypothetical protein
VVVAVHADLVAAVMAVVPAMVVRMLVACGAAIVMAIVLSDGGHGQAKSRNGEQRDEGGFHLIASPMQGVSVAS